MRGRKPKPTHLKVIEGNRGRRRLNENEPKPRPGRPPCPAWLQLEAKREWRRVVPELDRLGLLAVVDRASLAMYCQEWARYVDAQAQVDKYGSVLKATASGYVQPSPFVAIARQSLTACRTFAAEFGLTPSSRGRMQVPEAAPASECPVCAMPTALCGCG